MKNIKEKIQNIVDDALAEINEEMLNEMGMPKAMFGEKYGEVIGSIVDNLVAISLFRENPAIPHWRNRALGLCQRFVNVDMVPLKSNTYEKRLSALDKGVSIELNDDFSAIKNHIKSVMDYYTNRKNKEERIYSPLSIEEATEKYFENIKNAVIQITKSVAEQDNAQLTQIIENF